MGWKGVQYYVYRTPVLGVRTNCSPGLWESNKEVNDFLDNCPDYTCIGFDVVDGKPVEKAKCSLKKPGV